LVKGAAAKRSLFTRSAVAEVISPSGESLETAASVGRRRKF